MRSLAKLPQDFADLLIELLEANAEFLLVGGWAVILYGHVRATDDMDIFVRPSRANSERVFAALEDFGAPLRAHAVAPGHFAREGDAYRFGIAPLKIEVLTKISGVSFDEALRGSKTFEKRSAQPADAPSRTSRSPSKRVSSAGSSARACSLLRRQHRTIPNRKTRARSKRAWLARSESASSCDSNPPLSRLRLLQLRQKALSSESV